MRENGEKKGGGKGERKVITLSLYQELPRVGNSSPSYK